MLVYQIKGAAKILYCIFLNGSVINERNGYMKKIIVLISAAALIVSMAGCKKDETHNSQITDSSTSSASSEPGASNPPKTEEQIQEELDNFAKDADKNVNMDKLGGEKLKGESESGSDKGDLGGYEVAIKDAVTVASDNSNVIIIEFTFKNKTSEDTNFAGVIDVKAEQNNAYLPTAVTFSAEGYDVLTQAQTVKYNDTIKVQKAFILDNTDNPVIINVKKNDNIGGSEVISKTFNLK